MLYYAGFLLEFFVALRKESVDRNAAVACVVAVLAASLSARRAWIEIRLPAPLRCWWMVALRKESVDRNSVCGSHRAARRKSLSARRAWIEMANLAAALALSAASLSARRAWIEIDNPCNKCSYMMGRSPQGERG